MYIVPNTSIYILKNIPLNKSYEHTVYYPDKNAQAQAFMAYKKYTLTDYSYQRSQLGTIRVALKYEQLIDCNYLMFKNTNFENKWFYAFITGIGYVSNDVTDVYYDLDVMQTWCYDYEFLPTFVDRQHSKDDVLYANTQPEGLELGPTYGYNTKLTFSPLNTPTSTDSTFLILATTYSNGSHPKPSAGTGIILSLHWSIKKQADAIAELKEFVDNGLEDNIIAIYNCPPDDKLNIAKEFKRTPTVGNYSPRNYKLLTSPYCFLSCYNHLGQTLELQYENFREKNTTSPPKDFDYQYHFEVISAQLPQPQSSLVIRYYLNSVGTDIAQYLLTYNVYPTGAISGDTFKVWLAQNKNTYSASLNAIGNTYDTNMAIAENNYTMAGLGAANARTNAHIQANSALTQAENSNKASLAINTAQSNKSVADTAINTGVNAIQNAGKALASGFDGISAVAAGAITAVGGIMSESFNQDIYSARANQINTQLLNSQIGAQAGEAISANTFQTAMKNATLAQTNAQLSALNTYQNATAQLMSKKQDIQMHPSNLHGALMNDTWNVRWNLIGFTVYEKFIKREYAERIDAYFDKYGYAQRTMYVPERQNRKHWSYLKTVGCNIKGNINNTDLVTIKTIYDNGITTWNNLEEVGNYALDNTVDRN